MTDDAIVTEGQLFYPRVSYSALKQWESCQASSVYRSRGEQRRIDHSFYIVGNVLGDALEWLVASGGSVTDIVGKAVADFDRRCAEQRPSWSGDRTQDTERERVRSGTAQLVELVSSEWLLNPGSARLSTEVPMRASFSRWALDGKIDLFVLRSDGSEVWDLKSGSSHHTDQLVFYDILTEFWLGSRPEVLGWIEPLGRGIVRVPISDEDRLEMKNRIRAMVEGVLSGRAEFDGYQSKCSWCSAKAFCAKWEASRRGTFVGGGHG